MNNFPNVAYFCMEYAIESNVKIYAGGLGILAGDYMKEACDNEYPLIGIGIKWKQGYGEQLIDKETNLPFDADKNRSYDFLKDTGVIVTVEINGRDVKIKVW